MNLYLRKDGRFESRIPNGKKPDRKRAFLYVLARTKEHFLKYIKYSCVIFMQSDEKSVCAICIPDLISASIIIEMEFFLKKRRKNTCFFCRFSV